MNRPIRPLTVKIPKRRPIPVPMRHEPLRQHPQPRGYPIGSSCSDYVADMKRLQNRDAGEIALYTAMRAYPDYRHVLDLGLTVGEEMTLAGAPLPAFEMIDGHVRWQFANSASALMFKLKFGNMIVPPPWKDLFPA